MHRMEDNMKETLMKILQELRPDVEFETETALIDNGVLDSFDIVSLVGELNEEFDVEIGVENLTPENFNSVNSILTLLNKLQDAE